MKRLLGLPIALGAWLAARPVLASEGGSIKDPAEHWEHLWHEVLMDLYIFGGVFAVLAVYWILKYRASSEGQDGTAGTLDRAQTWGWALVPAFLFMADDFFLAAKGWTLWNIQRNVPENAMEVKVTGSMWTFSFEYENGVTSTFDVAEGKNAAGELGDGDGLVVPVGTPVVLRMTSTDVVHSFGLTEYRVKEDMMPGRITYLWFYPKEAKESYVTCVEYCGTNHSRMFAKVKALPQAEFDAWMAAKKKEQNQG
ncbi:MAG: hypothetical protein HQL82_10125 [Magnetococcales bacterium]|nr:hypothetical protein [Magnetococcales bacterium]